VISRTRATVATILTASLAFAGLISMPIAASAAPVVATSTTAAALPVPDATITGVVTTTTGKAIVGATVEVWLYDENTGETSDEPVATATTVTKGAYTLQVPAGLYFVEFRSPEGNPNYVDEYWKNSSTIWNSDLLVLESGDTAKKINGTLAASAHITGTILKPDATTFEASELEIDVCTVETYDDGEDSWSDVECGFGRATIDAAGKYTVSNIGAGSYTVHVTYTGTGNFRDEYYPNAHKPSDATTFTLKSGATVTGKNLVLDPGATITGVITGEGTGVLENATVGVHEDYTDEWGDSYNEPDETALKTVQTNADGEYTITGLWGATYYLNALTATAGDIDFAAEWFDNVYSSSRATPLAVTAATPIVRDIELAVASDLRGTVLDVAGEPVAGITVTLSRALSATDNRDEYITEVVTDDSGAYAFENLAEGEYFVYYDEYSEDDEWSTYLGQYYGAAAGEGIHEASRINLGGGNDSVVDLNVTRGGSYTGTVFADGEPLADASVAALSDGFYAAEASTDENGEFTLTGLPAGGYTIEVEYYGPFDPDDECWYDDDCVYTGPQYQTLSIVASPVAVDSEPTGLGKLVLDASNTINGTVTGSTGKTVKNAELVAYAKGSDGYREVDGARSDAKGRFSLTDIPRGDIYILIYASGYPVQFLGGTDNETFATPVRVDDSARTITRDIQLFKGSSVSGTIRDSVTGRALPDVLVLAEKYGTDAAVSPQLTSLSETSRKGTYTLAGLSAGTYDISANSESLYDDFSDHESKVTKVAIGSKDVTTNFALAPLSRITGKVTDSEGTPLAFIDVFAFPEFGDAYDYGFTSTDQFGRYTLYVKPGNYVLDFADNSNAHAETFSGGVADYEDASIVTAGATSVTANVTMLNFPGRVTATITGEFDNELDGYALLERTPVGGGEPWTYFIWLDTLYDATLSIPNLRTGDYSMSISASDWEGDLEGYTGTFTITDDDPLVDLGSISLGNNLGWVDEEYPGNIGDLPVITSATPTVGDELQLDTGDWDEEIVDFEYQWFRNGTAILGATHSSYFVTPGDAGKKISARLIPLTIDGPEYRSYLETAATEPVLKAAAANAFTEPSISGLTRVGQTLTLDAGEWDLDGLSFAYSWVRTTGEKTKVVSTKATYKPVIADITSGSTLSATVTVTRAGFESTSRTVEVGDIQPAAALTQTKKSVVSYDDETDTYSVTPGTWSPKGAVISYAWFISDEDGEGGAGEGSTYTPNPGQEHFAISVKVTAKKPGYATTTVEHFARPLAQLEWLSEPTTGGTNQVGGVLTINTNGAATEPEATGYTFEWRVDGTVVKGATKSTYSPTKAGGDVTAVVTATRTRFGSVSTEPVQFGVTTTGGSFQGDLAVSGNPAIGHTLTADLGYVSPTPTTATYQWFTSVNGGVPVKIAKATKSTYVPTAADYEAELTVVATLSRSGYLKTVLTAQSHPIEARMPSGKPTIVRTAKVGTAITAAPGEWDTVGTTFSYQWTLNGTEIFGATAQSYTPRPEDLDEEIAVIVTGKIAGVAPSPVTSNSVTIEPGAAPKPTKAPAITVGGKSVTKTTLGKTLTASAGTWKASGIALEYQWQIMDGAVWVDIASANGKTLKLDSDAFASGSKVRVVVVATAAGYATSSPAASKTITVK